MQSLGARIMSNFTRFEGLRPAITGIIHKSAQAYTIIRRNN